MIQNGVTQVPTNLGPTLTEQTQPAQNNRGDLFLM